MRRWLDGVNSKLKEVIAPSSGNSPNTNYDGVACASLPTNKCGPTYSASSDLRLSVVLDEGLRQHLLELAQSVLTERQKYLLVSAAQELRWSSMTVTRLCERLSRETKMSYSTVKWNVRRLRVMNLLHGGTEKTKGAQAWLTPLGKVIAGIVVRPRDSAGKSAEECSTAPETDESGLCAVHGREPNNGSNKTATTQS